MTSHIRLILLCLLSVGCLNGNKNDTTNPPRETCATNAALCSPDLTGGAGRRLLNEKPDQAVIFSAVQYSIMQNGSCATTTSGTTTSQPCPEATQFNNRLSQAGTTVLLAGTKVPTTWKINFSSMQSNQLQGVLDPTTNHNVSCTFAGAEATCTNIFGESYTGNLNFKIYSVEHCNHNVRITNPSAVGTTCADITKFPTGTYTTKSINFEIIDVGAALTNQAMTVVCATSAVGGVIAKESIKDSTVNILAQAGFAIINSQNNCPTITSSTP